MKNLEAALDAALKERIDAFVAHAQAIIDAHYTAQLPNLVRTQEMMDAHKPLLKPYYMSDKWCRIENTTVHDLAHAHGRIHWEKIGETHVRVTDSVYCFVCLQSYATKALGAVKAGDIHKSATFKAPAKHKRGSVFSPDFDNCVTPYGALYLRG